MGADGGIGHAGGVLGEDEHEGKKKHEKIKVHTGKTGKTGKTGTTACRRNTDGLCREARPRASAVKLADGALKR